jgi:tRNA(Ile)-lysidine synthase
LKKNTIHTKIIESIEKYNLFSVANDSILIGVSGGVDSMVLLDCLHKLKYKVSIAHCNFNLRDKESDEDEKFVEIYAQKNNIKFHKASFNTKQYAKEHKCSIEMAARELRYEWFESLCNEFSYTKIAIAHNQNDTIETFFINLLRSSGIKGLQGIPIQNNCIVRPLLSVSRKEIETYAKDNKIPFRVDSSNLTNDYVRNKIRNIIIPAFSDIQESANDSFYTSIGHLEQAFKVYNSTIQSIIPTIVTNTEHGITIDENLLMKYDFTSTILFEILHPFGFNSDKISQIIESFSAQSGKQFESDTHIALHDRNKLLIQKKNIENNTFELIITEDFSNKISIPFGTISISKTSKKLIKIDANKKNAYVDFNKLTFPLTIRNWEPGDSFIPFGMKGNKKVSDFLIDEKISILDKQKILVIESNKEIIWIIGQRISQKYAISDLTSEVLVFQTN